MVFCFPYFLQMANFMRASFEFCCCCCVTDGCNGGSLNYSVVLLSFSFLFFIHCPLLLYQDDFIMEASM